MNDRDYAEAQKHEERLKYFHQNVAPLHGIQPVPNMLSFLQQLIDSLHRVRYVKVILSRSISSARADPYSPYFDPLRAAILSWRSNDVDNAFWLVFLATHCGKNLRTGWQLSAEIYGALGDRAPWTWVEVSQRTSEFTAWLSHNHHRIQGKFGNHRKYESLKPGGNGTAAAVASYVHWIAQAGGHQLLMNQLIHDFGNSPRALFNAMYTDMSSVHRFGRTGKFDYLTMLSKLEFAPIEADSPYIMEATGPLSGARLFFDGKIDSASTPRSMENRVIELESALGVGMQVLEDSLCNWQKSPGKYVAFRG